MAEDRPSPKTFLKARRPERFSDSFVDEGPRLERTTVEYHLHTLTSRSQEIEFQTFARHLLQREVCPNLLPQSGPTGGGDSKVDSETYPVSDEHSLVWYVGTGRDAAEERWAFAFSTKEKWRPKVQSDMAKIAGTSRDYTKAFFVTNQFVSDKKRAEVEDALTEKHGFDVRIFDCTWILDRVFAGNHEDLLINDLKLECDLRTTVRKGPLDTLREAELLELEERIAASPGDSDKGHQLADDCIQAVILARGLEKPRTEVDGLLSRAERVAQRCGTSHQQLVAAYQHAWTAFWHFEDIDEFLKWYSVVEDRATGSDNIYHAELLSNSWNLLTMAFHDGHINSEGFEKHTSTLIDELDRFVADESRPSAALHARSMRLLVELMRTRMSEPDPLFQELKDVVESSEHLIGFPLEPLVEILTEIGTGVEDSTAFDELFDAIESVWARREGDLAAARLLLGRGAQQLDSRRPLKAIRTLGRALTRLFKDESRDELISALYLCSSAYEQIGLLWAARGTAVTAAALAVDEFWKYENVTRLQAGCFNRLKWIELKLGRLPQSLAWYESDQIARSALQAQGVATDALEESDQAFDAILGMQFLRLECWDLKSLGKLPESLERINLMLASAALRYALGDEQYLSQLFQVEEPELYDFVRQWRDQPAKEDLHNLPQLGESQLLTLEATIAGCHVTVECHNEQYCLAVAESLLASLESLLSTGLADRVFARQPTLNVQVRTVHFGESPFSFEMNEREGRHTLEVGCVEINPHRMSADEQAEARRRLLEMVVNCTLHCFFINDADSLTDRMFGDERAVERAIYFTSSFVVLGNVLGDSPRTMISDWIDQESDEVRLTRDTEWDADERTQESAADTTSDPFEFGTGDPNTPRPDPDNIKHSKMKAVSVIRETLWERAGWAGVATAVFEEPNAPPYLLPVFRDRDAAEAIFRGLHEDIGAVDSSDLLRVVLIRGISRTNPHAYRIVFGTQPPNVARATQWQIIAIISRVQTMTPTSSINMDRFLQRYAELNEYVIAPCVMNADESVDEPNFDLGVQKQQLVIRDAWQVGLNDIDSAGILPDDDPIVPDGETEPPIAALLAWKRER